MDSSAGTGMGIAATWVRERAFAITGKQEYARSRFRSQESVMKAGVLFSLPALLSQGLGKCFEVFKPLPPGFYGLHHIILILAFMALCRIKNPEQLKTIPVGEFGKIIGLDRVPQVEYFRKKIKQITGQARCDSLHTALFHDWSDKMKDTFFYIDGHVRIYSGYLSHLPKHFVSREKLCLSSTLEFYVNTFDGLPLMVITGELNEKLKDAIEEAIEKIKKAVPEAKTPSEPHFTLVFDREAYEPLWFIKLWEEHRVAVISYRKNVKEKWDDKLFNKSDMEFNNNIVTMQLCEMGSLIQGKWFREVRKLSQSGHQTAIITTHPSLIAGYIAARMFTRWTQENFFKYMGENFDFDRIIEYGCMELSNKERKIPNPEYRQLTGCLKKAREKKARIEAKVFQHLEKEDMKSLHEVKEKQKYAHWIEEIEGYNKEIEDLTAKRRSTSAKLKIKDMPDELRFNKLKTESKKLKNIILMIAYRAESALYSLLPKIYKNTDRDGRQLLKEIFASDADLLPDYQNKILEVRLHSLSTPGANETVKCICRILNDTDTIYPFSDLKLVYKSVAT
jgi:hypothetical protein